MRNLYEILGVQKDADQAAIRKAFKTLARKYHPDVSQERDAETRFKEINAAYEVLSDEQKRSWYDEFGEESLRVGFDADRARAYRSAAGAGGFGFDPGGFGGGVSLDELFGSMFGGGARRRPGRSGWGDPVTVRRRGADVEASVEIDLLTAIRGGDSLIQLRRPASCGACAGEGGTGKQSCASCRGSGRVTQNRFGMQAVVLCESCAGSGTSFAQECAACAGSGRVMEDKRVRVHIPAGVSDGKVLRLRGLGGEGRHGGPAGNLLVSIRVRPHPVLSRKGDDLEIEVPITPGEALGGARIAVPTPDGDVKVRVPAGVKNGQQLRLEGRGLPRQGGGRGHLYLVLRPILPSTDDPEALALARELDAYLEEDVRASLKL